MTILFTNPISPMPTPDSALFDSEISTCLVALWLTSISTPAGLVQDSAPIPSSPRQRDRLCKRPACALLDLQDVLVGRPSGADRLKGELDLLFYQWGVNLLDLRGEACELGFGAEFGDADDLVRGADGGGYWVLA